MKKLFRWSFGFIIIFAFGACNASNATSEVQVAVQPTNTTFISPISTAPFVPTVDPLTPSAIAQFFHTLEATTVTPELPYILSYEDCSQGWSVLGSWALCDSFTDPITIINTSNEIWKFSYKSHYGREVLHPCTRFLYLTNDGKYLYFSLDSDCGMIEPGFVFSISVFRWNLTNGEVSETLKAFYNFENQEGNYYSVSISPNGRRMAYIYPQKSPLVLNILDLQTGESRAYALDEKYKNGGQFTWSEDGTRLVFMLESEKDNNSFISMVFLDLLKDNSMVTFIKDTEFS